VSRGYIVPKYITRGIIVNKLPPKSLVKTWLFVASRSDYIEAQTVAIQNIERVFKTVIAAIEYVES
jgi:hypothetical protein